MTSECQGVKTHVSRDPGRSETVLRGHKDHYISWDTFVTSPSFGFVVWTKRRSPTHLHHLQLICNHHDHPMAGHFGHRKTIDLIRRSCHWPGLTQMVKQYIRSCTVCARSKANRHKPYGFLKQLPIPP